MRRWAELLLRRMLILDSSGQSFSRCQYTCLDLLMTSLLNNAFDHLHSDHSDLLMSLKGEQMVGKSGK